MAGYTPHLLLLGFVILFFIWEKFSPKAVEKFEDNLLIILMGLLTVVSFSQVIARNFWRKYRFNLWINIT
jgi:C4-dicarboxylate transporter DctQ subunit